jgi:RHS repeat-associated protein
MNRQVTVNVFMPLPGGEQATYTSQTIRFRHYDWQGSARLESNMTEHEYGDIAYAPFGESYAILNTPYPSFTGQQQDTISGLYDFLYREYSAAEGRWISPDPAGVGAANPANPQSWNRYAYVINSPLAMTDPLGLADCRGADPVCFTNIQDEWNWLGVSIDPWYTQPNPCNDTPQICGTPSLSGNLEARAETNYEWSIGATSDWVPGPVGPGAYGCDGPMCWYPLAAGAPQITELPVLRFLSKLQVLLQDKPLVQLLLVKRPELAYPMGP